MGTHWGNEGQVKVGSNTVAEILEFEFSEEVEPVDDTAMGDTGRTHIPGSGIPGWSGSATAHWDETDTNGQEALSIGASVTLNLYPEGSTSGDQYRTGLATVTNRTQTQKHDGETVRVTFTFLGNGLLGKATV